MLELYQLTFNSKLLGNLDQARRNWIVFLGHVANEIMCLQKLLLWSDSTLSAPSEDVRRIAASSQAIFIAKLLIGKQWELYKVLANSYLKNPLRAAVEQRMQAHGIDATSKIEAAFADPESIYSIVRNRFAFHYSLSEFGGQFNSARKAEALRFYYAKTRHNTLYQASEVIVNRAMLSKIDPDAYVAINKLIDAGIDGAKWVGDFCDGFMEAVLGPACEKADTVLETVQTTGPQFADVRIPWFTEGDARAISSRE